MADVLVIDDERDCAESTARWLELIGHNVRIARNGRDAIGAARRQRPSAVVLDLGMPGMDGLQVAAALRRDLPGPLMIIAITGYADAEYRRQALAAGCDYHFPKPIDPNALAALLAGADISPDSGVDDAPDSQCRGDEVDCAGTSSNPEPVSPMAAKLTNDAAPPGVLSA
jgi:CheY-like chemotaxis protein